MLKNIKIGKKLILGFILVAIISSVASIVGLSQMTLMDTSYREALNNYGFSQGDVGLFNAEFNESRTNIRDVIISTDAAALNKYSTQLTQTNAKIDTSFANMKKSMVNEKELSYYNDIKDNLAKYRTISDQVVEFSKQYRNAEAQELMTEQCNPISDKVAVSINSLISEKTTTGDQIAANLNSQGNTAKLTIIIFVLASFIISLIIALKIARSISKPVKVMADAAQRMAKGDLNVQISVDSKDEIGQLGAAFTESAASIKAYITDITENLAEVEQGNLDAPFNMDYIGDYQALGNAYQGILTSLNSTLGQINQASEQVSSGSEQVSNGAQALAQGATEQASSIEELSASITDISTQVKDNAEHAAEASVNVDHVRSEIETSNHYMGEMISAMSQINDSSSQIGKIIKTIEDIAFQTNILALNAAVEAARAGAAGKGFAVVADEVRNLASKSAEAAKDTTALIENSMKQVENGTRIADETAKSLLRVVDSAKAVSDTVEQISKASNRQSDAIGQVTLGVDKISGVVQTNSATAEESAAASEELSGQAQVMKELVGKFKLRNQISHNQTDQSEQQQPESKGVD
jgi:methyl-accepting chemotaxis protein